MNRVQLITLYAFSKFPYSERLDDLNDLKKYLLLELKTADSLLISETVWSKNDVIIFFDSALSPIEFDYYQFLIDFPWVKRLENIEAISYDEALSTVDFSDERFELHQREGFKLEESFLKLYKQRILTHRYKEASGLLQYKWLFSPSFQSSLQREAAIVFKKRFSELTDNSFFRKKPTLEQVLFFQNPDYYFFLKEIADAELRKTHFQTFYKIMDLFSIATIEEIMDYHEKLRQNFEDDIEITQINLRFSVMKIKEPLSILNKKRLKRKLKNKTLMTNIIVIALLLFVLIRCLGR